MGGEGEAESIYMYLIVGACLVRLGPKFKQDCDHIFPLCSETKGKVNTK